jgi:hypothetical protein
MNVETKYFYLSYSPELNIKLRVRISNATGNFALKRSKRVMDKKTKAEKFMIAIFSNRLSMAPLLTGIAST